MAKAKSDLNQPVSGSTPDRITVRVTSAVPMTAGEKSEIGRYVSSRGHRNVIYIYDVDPDVIGGVSIAIEDMMIDVTIATQLQNLQIQLKK